MRIVADENIAGLQEYFSEYADLRRVSGRDISPDVLVDADVLLVRSVTTVNDKLLAGSPVQFVGSCTIGTDHLDTKWLDQQAISWAYAPGCNAKAVVDYVLVSMLALDLPLQAITVGIVGCGNVGGMLNRQLKQLGIRTLCCDPFLNDHDEQAYMELDALLPLCDVICLHTPLTHQGLHPTYHLMNESRLALLKPDAILLNAGRGAVVDSEALLIHAKRYTNFRMVLDVWENEPCISSELLERATIATPHIAGYSLAGRWRGTEMIYQSFCKKFSLSPKTIPFPSGWRANLDLPLRAWKEILEIYNPLSDSEQLKIAVTLDDRARGLYFDNLRKNYVQRPELPESLRFR